MPTSLRSSIFGRRYYRMLELWVVPGLLKLPLTPNQMSLAGTLLAVLVPLGFLGHPAIGLILILLSAVADSLDGLLARTANRDCPFGAFLDSSLDRLSDAFYLIGFWILFRPYPGLLVATLLVFAALVTTMMISYVKARAEALNASCCSGWMDRGVRVLYLIVWALMLTFFPKIRQGVLWGGFVFYLGLAVGTVIQRVVHVRSQMLKG